MIIFRAGLTGCLAACVNPDATILDESQGPYFHKAVLRFRSDEISRITGIPFKKIKVTKSVFDSTSWKFVDWNPATANNYSRKVIGGIYDRSIDKLEPVTRWLAPDNFHEQLIDMIGDRIIWNDSYIPMTKGPKISTLPMPELLQMLDVEELINLNTHFNSIFVTTIDVGIDCDVNQTVYVVGWDTPVYRMTLEGRKIIVESVAPIMAESEIEEYVSDVFGLNGDWNIKESNYEQRIGKIAPVDDELRKELIFRITDEYEIYSLGRTAIWKNILLDDCLQDIRMINAMISKTKYQRMLGK